MKKIIYLFLVLNFKYEISRAQYCIPHSTNIFPHHQLLYFQFDTLINITSDVNPNEYNDYSDTLEINSSIQGKHFILLSKGQDPNNPGVGNTMGISIWIDFNNDSIFSNIEMIYSKYDGSYTFTDSLLFPSMVTTGKHRLRVRHEWGAAPDSPCDYLWGGETEDYTINIKDFENTVSINEKTKDIFILAYPNPSNNFFYIELKNNHSKVEIEIYDISGRKIFTRYTNTQKVEIDIDGSPGVYYACIKSESKTKIIKLIKI